MKLHAGDVQVNVRIMNEHIAQTIVMLHGFTGSVMTWDETRKWLDDYRVITIDLIGHGNTDSPQDISLYTMENQVEILESVFEQLNLTDFALLGYSMGGRVALSYAVAMPHRINHLILESASPGLKTEEERASRRAADQKLAERIVSKGIQSFVAEWENIPLFATQKNLPLSVQQKIRDERLSQRTIGLSNSLIGMGTGSQKSLWLHLGDLSFPATIITGEYDEKFCKIGLEMKKLIQNANYFKINGVGHAIHVENPMQFAKIVKDAIEYKIEQ